MLKLIKYIRLRIGIVLIAWLKKNEILKALFLECLALGFLVSCASTIEELKNVGKRPALSEVDPPVVWAKSNEPVVAQNANSLWQPGSRDFFRDNRARRIGDILKVNVLIQDYAKLNNQTTTTRKNSEDMGLTGLFGLQRLKQKVMTSPLVDTTSDNSIAGTGLVDRKENIKIEVAAMVKKIFPNGSLVIYGSQEIRINSEIRELSVEGIVRQEDISADNSVNSDQIAEARISYGGRGNLSRAQQPRYGSQILDIVLPW